MEFPMEKYMTAIWRRYFEEFKAKGTYAAYEKLRFLFSPSKKWNDTFKHEIINVLFAVYRKPEQMDCELAKRNYDKQLRLDHIAILLKEHTTENRVGSIAFSIISNYPEEFQLVQCFLKNVVDNQYVLGDVGMTTKNSALFFTNLNDVIAITDILHNLGKLDIGFMMSMIAYRMEIIQISILHKTNRLTIDHLFAIMKSLHYVATDLFKNVKKSRDDWKKHITKFLGAFTKAGVTLGTHWTALNSALNQ
jgi:hypothetical protein